MKFYQETRRRMVRAIAETRTRLRYLAVLTFSIESAVFRAHTSYRMYIERILIVLASYAAVIITKKVGAIRSAGAE